MGRGRSEVAAELALHFQRGQDAPRAVQYLGQAADNAAQRQAPHEVITLLTTALGLLATLPETPARAQQELPLQLTLAVALSEVKGQAAPEVDQTYARIRVLCAQVGETPQLVQMLLGLHWFHLTREALSTAREMGEQLAQLAQHTASPADLLTAHSALGFTPSCGATMGRRRPTARRGSPCSTRRRSGTRRCAMAMRRGSSA